MFPRPFNPLGFGEEIVTNFRSDTSPDGKSIQLETLRRMPLHRNLALVGELCSPGS